MSTRVEGRISLRLHGTESAADAASFLALAFALAEAESLDANYEGIFPEGILVDVVGLDLVQIREDDDAVHHGG